MKHLTSHPTGVHEGRLNAWMPIPKVIVATLPPSDSLQKLSARIAKVSHAGNTTEYTLVEGEDFPGRRAYGRQDRSHSPSSKDTHPVDKMVAKTLGI